MIRLFSIDRLPSVTFSACSSLHYSLLFSLNPLRHACKLTPHPGMKNTTSGKGWKCVQRSVEMCTAGVGTPSNSRWTVERKSLMRYSFKLFPASHQLILPFLSRGASYLPRSFLLFHQGEGETDCCRRAGAHRQRREPEASVAAEIIYICL